MKKPSYEELVQQIRSLTSRNTLLHLYLHDSTNQEGFKHMHSTFSDDEKYKATLYRATSADGGYVVICDLKDGACPTIVLLDVIDAKWPVEFRILADRLRVIRQRIFDEEKQAVCNSKR